MYGAGVFPQATYGGETCGFYPQMVDAVRTMGADVLGTSLQWRCPITAIAIGKGIEWDPWVRGPGTVIREAIAAAYKIGTAAVAEVWPTITTQTWEAVNPWATVKGPLGALYIHLSDMGWKLGFGPKPMRQLSIFSHQDEQWKSEPQSGWGDIQRNIDKRRISMLWAQAATHRHGGGMEDGVDVTVIRKHYCVLIKRGAMAHTDCAQVIEPNQLCHNMLHLVLLGRIDSS